MKAELYVSHIFIQCCFWLTDIFGLIWFPFFIQSNVTTLKKRCLIVIPSNCYLSVVEIEMKLCDRFWSAPVWSGYFLLLTFIEFLKFFGQVLFSSCLLSLAKLKIFALQSLCHSVQEKHPMFVLYWRSSP